MTFKLPTYSEDSLREAMDKAAAVADYTKQEHGAKGPHFSTLFLFDDSMSDGALRHSRAFSDLFIIGRHDFMSVFWLCHSWRLGLHPTARKQLSSLYCFRLRNNADRTALFGPSGELSAFRKHEDLEAAYETATSEPYGWLNVSLSQKDPKRILRNQFGAFL